MSADPEGWQRLRHLFSPDTLWKGLVPPLDGEFNDPFAEEVALWYGSSIFAGYLGLALGARYQYIQEKTTGPLATFNPASVSREVAVQMQAQRLQRILRFTSRSGLKMFGLASVIMGAGTALSVYMNQPGSSRDHTLKCVSMGAIAGAALHVVPPLPSRGMTAIPKVGLILGLTVGMATGALFSKPLEALLDWAEPEWRHKQPLQLPGAGGLQQHQGSSGGRGAAPAEDLARDTRLAGEEMVDPYAEKQQEQGQQ